ncbi:MAG: SCO family protein [bacterium]
MNRCRKTLLALLCGAAALAANCRSSDTLRGTTLPDMPFTDFTLTDQNGNLFTLSDHKGKVILMFFGYTTCPDVCPLTLSTWRQVEEKLQDEAGEVEFVYITVDPQRDTQQKLQNHLAVFSQSFIGLTGTAEELDPVYRGYGVYREKQEISESAAGYLMNHTSSMYFLDRNGIWKSRMSNDAKADDIVHDIRVLLKS